MSGDGAHVYVFGLGKLGLPLAALLATSPVVDSVVGIDPMSGTALLAPFIDVEPGLRGLLDEAENLAITDEVPTGEADHADFAFIVVPTPSLSTGAYDLTFVRQALDAIVASGNVDTVVLVSTVSPGSCEKLEREFKLKERRIELLYSPEFIALGNVIAGMEEPHIVLVGAEDAHGFDRFRMLMRSIHCTLPKWFMLTPIEAELAKIAVNSFITTKISFANEIARMCERTPGLDAARVLAAVGADKRIGGACLQPGGPFGGPCFPRDNEALLEFSPLARLPYATMRANGARAVQLHGFVTRVANKIGVRNVLVLGTTYKANTLVEDRSYGVLLSKYLQAIGFEVMSIAVASSAWPTVPQWLRKDEVTVIATPDPEWGRIVAQQNFTEAGAIIDVWGVLPKEVQGENVYRVGVHYP